MLKSKVAAILARTQFTIENVPPSALDPEIRQINIAVSGGRLFASGLVEYSPKVTRVQVDNATIKGVVVDYVHTPAIRGRRCVGSD